MRIVCAESAVLTSFIASVLSTSHKRTLPYWYPDAICLPSGEKVSERAASQMGYTISYCFVTIIGLPAFNILSLGP